MDNYRVKNLLYKGIFSHRKKVKLSSDPRHLILQIFSTSFRSDGRTVMHMKIMAVKTQSQVLAMFSQNNLNGVGNFKYCNRPTRS